MIRIKASSPRVFDWSCINSSPRLANRWVKNEERRDFGRGRPFIVLRVGLRLPGKRADRRSF